MKQKGLRSREPSLVALATRRNDDARPLYPQKFTQKFVYQRRSSVGTVRLRTKKPRSFFFLPYTLASGGTR
jgi:hypothetical protein